MANTAKYRVLRKLDGDRVYEPGDLREMLPADAAHLVRLGCLEKVSARAKADPTLVNKMEQSPAPSNKKVR